MLDYPHIDPIIFSIGPVAVRWYGLMYVIGFLLGWYLARRRCRRADSPVSAEEVDDLVFNAMLGVIVGGRVGYCLFYSFDTLLEDPLYLFRIWEGGMSFHGGLVGVLVAMWLFGRKRGKTMWQITDFMAPFVPLGLGFGRIGNFINGELWGKETTVPWAFNVDGRVLHPSQLYEALLEGLLLFVILWVYSSKPRPYRAVSGMFLLFYGIFRFFVEFYRVPDADKGYIAFDWLTMGQILSAPMIIIGAFILYFAYRHPTEPNA
jgi:phosphatidylglycerol:prolipoprotein diacylglycerol transferase